ncbi:zinc ribbon domain-containing protein [Aquisalibacillus elongatus]|uniref:Double zinc ribbon protein n=1 Tax=Aquisalibacillus elongatus TaxID=485577 RepID=A0A3N5B4V2_9BACI|nr:zinc ribbon domain-containing protein [Aquisalibacillus elongatus]RPF52139.1 hypothetical protein EDC24_2129 [Aquisalibacillus elongatus]
MIYCTKCGTANSPTSHYCIHDGYPLHKPHESKVLNRENYEFECPNCGSNKVKDALYCHFCGETFEQLEATQMEDHRQISYSRENLNYKFVGKTMLKMAPFVIISMIMIAFLTYFSVGEETNGEPGYVDSQEYNPSQEIFYQYRYITSSFKNIKDEINHFNRNNNNQGEPEPTELEEGNGMSPFDLLLIANLVPTEVESSNFDKREEVIDYSTKNTSYMGLAYYFVIAMVSIAIVSIVIMRRVQFNNWQDLLLKALAFSTVYALILFVVSLVTQYTGSMDGRDFIRESSLSFLSLHSLWKGFLISFVVILSVFSFTRKVELPRGIKAIKYSAILSMILFSIMLIFSSIVYFKDLRHSEVMELLNANPSIFSLVIIVQIAVYLLNIVFLNKLEFLRRSGDPNGGEPIELDELHEFLNYHLFSKPIDIRREYADIYQSITNYETIYWLLFAVTVVFIVVIARRFSGLNISTRLKSIFVYSLVVSMMMAFLIYSGTHLSSSLTMVSEREEFRNEAILGASAFQMFLRSFGIVFVISIIGSYLKVSKERD